MEVYLEVKMKKETLHLDPKPRIPIWVRVIYKEAMPSKNSAGSHLRAPEVLFGSTCQHSCIGKYQFD